MAHTLEALAIVSGRLVSTRGALCVSNCRHGFHVIKGIYFNLPGHISYMYTHVNYFLLACKEGKKNVCFDTMFLWPG